MKPTDIQIQPHQDAVALEAELARKVTAFMSQVGVFKNCCTCSKFVEVMELCEEFNARPPARVIAYGCVKHSHTIPF